MVASPAHGERGMETPPNPNPSAERSAPVTAENRRLIRSFAVKYAMGGIGVARFRSIHPRPRSIATPTPREKSDAPITPKAPYVAIRYVASETGPTACFVPKL